MPYGGRESRIGSIALQKAVEQTQVRLDELSRGWRQAGVVPSTALELDKLTEQAQQDAITVMAGLAQRGIALVSIDEVAILQDENRSLRYILASLIQHAGGEIHVPDEYLVSTSQDAPIATERDVERCVTIYRLRQ